MVERQLALEVVAVLVEEPDPDDEVEPDDELELSDFEPESFAPESLAPPLARESVR